MTLNSPTHWISIVAATFLLAASSLAVAQTAAPESKSTAAAPAKKTTAKPKPKVVKKKATTTPARTNLKSVATNVAAGVEAAETAMTPAELSIAERVDVGKLPCELGASVTLSADDKNPGYFNVQGKNFSYRMFPIATSTGAIRLEDKKAGAVWLQLANKSMLMNQKLGVRLADECMSPAQVAVAEQLKNSPAASILEPFKP